MEFVLVCKTGAATPPVPDLANLKILRSSNRLFLVEFHGKESDLRALLGAGWIVSPNRRYHLS